MKSVKDREWNKTLMMLKERKLMYGILRRREGLPEGQSLWEDYTRSKDKT